MATRKDEQAQPDQFIEDAQAGPGPTADPLADDALVAGGLRKFTGWVRTKQTAEAMRKSKSRKKQEDTGFKQLNVLLPNDDVSRLTFKALAKAVCDGKVDISDLMMHLAKRGVSTSRGAAEFASIERESAPAEGSRSESGVTH